MWQWLVVGDGLLKVDSNIVYRIFQLKIYCLKDQSAGDPANILQKGSVNVWKNSNCQESFLEKGSDIIITDKQICAGHVNGGIDSCWVSSFGCLFNIFYLNQRGSHQNSKH